MEKKKRITLLYPVLAAILVYADQYTKRLAVLYLRGTEGIALIDGVLELSYVENFGAAFGILRNMRMVFILLTVIVLAFILYVFLKSPAGPRYRYLRLVLTVLAAGAAGNLIDRVKTAYVVDFIYFSLIDFPVFNFADICVTVSAAGLFLLVLFYYKDEEFAFLRLPDGDRTPGRDNDA